MAKSVLTSVGEALADEVNETQESGGPEDTEMGGDVESTEVSEGIDTIEGDGTGGTTGTVVPPEQATDLVGRFPDAVVYTLGILVFMLTAAVIVLALQQGKRPRRRRRTRERQDTHDRATTELRAQRAPKPSPTTKPGPEKEPLPEPASSRNLEVGEEICDTIAPDNVNDMPVGALISIGKLHGQGQRDQQQDSFGVSDPAMSVTHGQLAVVCDGMGGLENGAAVSSIAVETILQRFLLLPQGTDPLHALESLVVDANMAVNAMLGPDGIRVCGSTLVMALVRDGALGFVSIGDSRICLYRDKALMQLNREHDYKGELVVKAINGDMSLFDALSDEQGHGLVSYLGMGRISAIDVPSAPLELRHGDVVILMSDGVYNALTDAEISRALDLGNPDAAADALGAAIAAKAFERQDNYTAVVMEI